MSKQMDSSAHDLMAVHVLPETGSVDDVIGVCLIVTSCTLAYLLLYVHIVASPFPNKHKLPT